MEGLFDNAIVLNAKDDKLIDYSEYKNKQYLRSTLDLESFTYLEITYRYKNGTYASLKFKCEEL